MPQGLASETWVSGAARSLRADVQSDSIPTTPISPVANAGHSTKASSPQTPAGPVEDIIDDPVHGPLAPEAELGENEPEHILERWARELREGTEARRLATEPTHDDPETAQTTAHETTHPASHTSGTCISPSCFQIIATAATIPPQPHKPNRASRRHALKQLTRRPNRPTR